MITIRLEITDYHSNSNTCTAKLQNGDIVSIDPFVSCAVPMTDEQYERGFGESLVGKSFLLTKYTVYADQIVPHEGGMVPI